MKQGVSAVSRNALFFRCGYSPDLLAALQGNPGQPTPFFASVATLAVLALPLIIARGAFFYCPKRAKPFWGSIMPRGWRTARSSPSRRAGGPPPADGRRGRCRPPA